jgi:hypothetical protein
VVPASEPHTALVLLALGGIASSGALLVLAACYAIDAARWARRLAALTAARDGLKQLLETHGECRVEIDELVEDGRPKIRIRVFPAAPP